MIERKDENSASEFLRGSNSRLKSTVQELRLEILYYQGETKRLEWENNVLKQDVAKMSVLFKGWLNELQCSNTRNVLDETEYIKNLVNNPTKNIAEILQLTDSKLLVTSCQAPFYIEHANKAWSNECGWESHEVLGLTCAFLQGELTDLRTAASFTKSMRELGYANMRINNYRKNGTVFNVSITSFPIYDSVSAKGNNSDVPILTHFATFLSDIRNLTAADVCEGSKSVTQVLEANITPNSLIAPHNMNQIGGSSFSSCSASTSSVPSLCTSITTSSSASSTRHFDRRVRSRKFDLECRMTSETFLETASTIRLSDLLRLMLSCEDAMVLTDKIGRIVHCNRPWALLTGHSLTDAEGLDYSILDGSMTDCAEINRCRGLRKALQSSVSTVVNYRKDGLMFMNSVTTSPIRGVYMSEDVSHFCALQLPEAPSYRVQNCFGMDLDNPSKGHGKIKLCSAKRSRHASCDSDGDSGDEQEIERELEIESYTAEMRRAVSDVYSINQQPEHKYANMFCASTEGIFYNDEITIENEGQSRSSDSGSTTQDQDRTFNSDSTSSSGSSSMRFYQDKELDPESVNNNTNVNKNINTNCDKSMYSRTNVHNSKKVSKHLRIQSNVEQSENNGSGNSTSKFSSPSGSTVDSPITDGNDSP